MQCPFKLFESEVMEFAGGSNRTQYYYQECTGNGCQMWSDTLQDCRLAWSGMRPITAKEETGIYQEHKG